MGVAIVNACFSGQRKKINTNVLNLWYDSEAEWLISANGGKMIFTYDAKIGKNSIKMADNAIVVNRTVSNYETILNWFKENKGQFDLEMIEAGSGVVAFSFPDEMNTDVEDALDFNNFQYEIM